MSFVFCGAFLYKKKEFDLCSAALISIPVTALTVGIGSNELFSAVNTVLMFAVLYAVQKLYYKAGYIRTFITFLSFYAVLFTADLITSALISLIMETTISDIFSSFSNGRVVAALASKAILSVICITFYRIAHKKAAMNARLNVLFSLSSIMILLISVVLYFNYSRSVGEQMNLTLTILFIVILLLVVSIYLGITYFFDSQQKQQESEIAKRQSEMLERSLKEQENTFSLWRKSVHDYKNTVLALDAMIKSGEYAKLSEFIEEEKESFQHRAEYIHTGNVTVDTVINTKAAVAAEKGIAFTVNAAMPEKCRMSDIHLASVIGNLIDNAVEAEEKEDEPYIDVQISKAQSFLIIKTVNKCTEPPADTETSKSDKARHGIGLKSVKNTVREYNGEFDLKFENGQAVAMVLIPNE